VSQSHPVLVSYPDKEKPPLITINRNLSDQLVKNLAEELFALLADAVLSRIFPMQCDVQLLLQVDNVDLGRWLGGHIPNPQRTILHVLVRRQDGVEEVLVFLRLLIELARLDLTILFGLKLCGN